MSRKLSFVGGFVVVSLALLAPGNGVAQEVLFDSNFDSDTVGLPPATGGVDQPTEIIGVGVLVKASSNGIGTQPLEVDDVVCNSGYYGGVNYTLPAVAAGVLRFEATIAANQVTGGTILNVHDTGIAVARLRLEENGTIVDFHGTVLSSYSANAPVRIRGDINMATKTWACTIDDELNGFGDDEAVSGLEFVNNPSIISQITGVTFALSGNFDNWACSGSRVIAYDDILIQTNPVLFADGFETGDLSAWSAVSGALAVDYCQLTWPASVTVALGQSADVFGRVLVTGVTDLTDAPDFHPLLLGAVGYGPLGTLPWMSADWTWLAATINPLFVNPSLDEFLAPLTPSELGSFDYAFAFSGDGGISWTFCDLDGSANGYEPAQAGQLTVVPGG